MSHIPNNDETWHSYTLPKEDSKNIKIASHILCGPLTLALFYRKFATLKYQEISM